VVAEAVWEALDAAGIPRDILALVDIDEGELGRQLIAHERRPRHPHRLVGDGGALPLVAADLPLLAETSGKNAMIVMPSADLDLAASDLVKSAFGHAGQKCSAASLAILVGPVARSERFARQPWMPPLAARRPALRPAQRGRPVIEPPRGKLAWALTTSRRASSGSSSRASSTTRPPSTPSGCGARHPRRGAARVAHAPRGVLRPDLASCTRRRSGGDRAAERRRVRPDGGLYTQDPADLELWLDEVEAGNLYVNRGITGRSCSASRSAAGSAPRWARGPAGGRTT
jgi:RHH-type proline utilization regulon transcriptional repressor/proline dehydrogenase/delta 1-pyrroline-5-carboxylate dehydrogenase